MVVTMKLLAIDSSGMVAGIAVLEDERILAEYTVDYKKTHSQTLVPMLAELQKMIELDLSSVDAIAVAAGPGSFTGLRIGSATVKGLAMAIDKPIIEVPTIDGMAYNMFGFDGIICPIMDARRNQVYTGFYTFEEKETAESQKQLSMTVVKEQYVDEISKVIEQLNEMGKKVVFLGDGVPAYEQTIKEQMKVPYLFAPANCNRQRAGAVAVLGAEYFKAGKMVSAVEHKPEYLRLSQAERERMERENAK